MRSVFVASFALAVGIACGASAVDETPAKKDDSNDGDGDDDDSRRDGGIATPNESCIDKSRIDALVVCLDEGKSPNACLAEHAAPNNDPCDSDQDRLDDGLEDALARAYSVVFAFNDGSGGSAGDPEPRWPANASHFAAHADLVYRRDGDESTRVEIAKSPKLDELPKATLAIDGGVVRADDPSLGAGPNFWLCLRKNGDTYPDLAVVSSLEASRALPDGVDVYSVVHPSHPAGSRYAFIGSMLLFAYNRYNADDHEGDWEGGGVFVDLETGAVAAVFTDRHPSSDEEKIVHLAGDGAAEAKDPNLDTPKYTVCSEGDVPRGVRFSDFNGPRHHPVFYVSTGDHAMYAYPGATRIKGTACIEGTMLRDTHNGKNAKLFSTAGGYATAYDPTDLVPIPKGVHFVNLGERDHLRQPWTAFLGAWGCQLQSFAKSFPGPWDNARLCRGYLTHSWGKEPPFVPVGSQGCDAQGK